MTEVDLENTIALLTRTPSALDTLLRGLSEFWTHSNERGSTWSAFDVIGHLIYAEHADWIPRAKWILQFGDSRPFPPFDRSGTSNGPAANRWKNCSWNSQKLVLKA